MLLLYPQLEEQYHFNPITHSEYNFLTRQWQLEQERRVQRQQLMRRIQLERERQERLQQEEFLTSFVAAVVQETQRRRQRSTQGQYGFSPLRQLQYPVASHSQCSCHGTCTDSSCFDLSARGNPYLVQQRDQAPHPAAWRITTKPTPQRQPTRAPVNADPLEALFGLLTPESRADSKPVAHESFPDPDLLDFARLSPGVKAPIAKPKQAESSPKPKQAHPKPSLKKTNPAPSAAVGEGPVYHVRFEDLFKTLFEEHKKELDSSKSSSEQQKVAPPAVAGPSKAARDPAVTLERKPAIRKASVSATLPPTQESAKPKSKADIEAEKVAEAEAAAAEQARLIRRYDSLASLSSIRSDFLNAQTHSNSPRARPSELVDVNTSEEIAESQSQPQSPADAKLYEETILRLLERLDGVESDGDDVIRFTRRSLARELADELEILDKFKTQRAEEPTTVQQENTKTEEEVAVTHQVDQETPHEEVTVPTGTNVAEIEAPQRITANEESVISKPEADVEEDDDATPVGETEVKDEEDIDDALSEAGSEVSLITLANDVAPTGVSAPSKTAAEAVESQPVDGSAEVGESENSVQVDVSVADVSEKDNEVLAVESAEVLEQVNTTPSVLSVPSDSQLTQEEVAPHSEVGRTEVVNSELAVETVEEVVVEGEVTHTFPPVSHPGNIATPSSIFEPDSRLSTASDPASEPDSASELGTSSVEASPQQAPTEIGSDVVVLTDEEEEQSGSSEDNGGKFELL